MKLKFLHLFPHAPRPFSWVNIRTKPFIAWSVCVNVIRVMTHALVGFPEFSQQHRCSGWRWSYSSSANCEVRPVIKFLNVQSIVPIEIHCQLCQQSFPAPCFTKLSVVQKTVRQVDSKATDTRIQSKVHGVSINNCGHLFLDLQKLISDQRQRFQNDREAEMSVTEHSVPNPRRQTSATRDTKVGPTVWKMSQFRRWIVEHLLYLLQ